MLRDTKILHVFMNNMEQLTYYTKKKLLKNYLEKQ